LPDVPNGVMLVDENQKRNIFFVQQLLKGYDVLFAFMVLI